MSSTGRFLAIVDELARSLPEGEADRAMRTFKRGRRVVIKLVKVAIWMLFAAIVIPVAMITAGLLFGPRGNEGLIATPLAVLTAWALILWGAYRTRATPRTIARAGLADLPRRTEEWLDRQRPTLPASARPQIDALMSRLETLGPQLVELDPKLPEALEVRRLVGEELPELVAGFQKLPYDLQRKPLHGGPSPKHRLIDALATIEEQIGRLQRRIADGDLRQLATHQRYLEIKYKEKGRDGPI
jgi:hypothetical protein